MIINCLTPPPRCHDSLLSGAYHDGVAYGLAYEDGHGTIELYDITFTNKPSALKAKDEYERDPQHQGMTIRVVVLDVRECCD